MNALIAAAVSHSRTVIAIMVLLLIAGAYAYVAIPKESDPDVNIPIVYVSMHLEGISPEDAERLLVRPMESELSTIEGVKQMDSTAYEGGGNVVLEFDAGFDADQAMTDVREAVDLVQPDLPAEADEPSVNEVNLSLFPILNVTLSGQVPERTLVRLARDLQDGIEQIPSVLEAPIAGDREEVVEIVIDPLLIESYGLTGSDAVSVVARSNQLVAAGTIDTGEGRFSVKVPGLYESVDDILNQPIAVNGDAVVLFRDVGEVRRTFRDPSSFARSEGAPAVVLEVSKRTGENIIETIEAVKYVVGLYEEQWPDTVEVTFSNDQSQDIRTMLADLQNNVISAILLVMIVVVGALGLRSAGFVGVAIPGSFLTGILVLYAMGLTVNIVVLFALILAVGMLVDGAIVVTEYADRKKAEGVGRVEAYRQAAQRMAWPITASTATTLAAFAPLLFWPGLVGEFMRFLPLTLIATLTASLLMALVFIPTLGSVFGSSGHKKKRSLGALAASEEGDLAKVGGFTGLYVGFLRGALRAWWLVIPGAIATLIGVWGYFATHGTGVEFFPDVEPEQAIILVHARGNMSVFEQDALVREVEERVFQFRDEFDSVYTRSGPPGTTSDIAEDVVGQITIEFADWDQRRVADVIMEDIRVATADLAGITVETREPDAGPPVGKPIQIELQSNDQRALAEATAIVRDYVNGIEGLVDIEDSRPLPGIEWRIEVDRAQAAKYGLDVAGVGESIRLVTNGLKLGTYRPDDTDDEIDILVRYPENWRSIEQLDNVRVVTDAGAVPITNFVTRTPEPLVSAIHRKDGTRIMTVKADVVPGILPDTIVQQLREWIPTAGLPAGVSYAFAGEDEEQAAAQDFLGRAFGIALFIMAIILVTQFNSFYSAFLILSAVIMSTIGVTIGLMVTQQPFGIVMTGIGVIALAGIVVNNNIVLIDTYDRLKKSSRTPMEAVLRTGAQRLRPVLLTTITTMLGLMPMVMSTNIDFITREVSVGAPSTQWWVSISTAVVWGLGFATILTLVVTPCALQMKADIDAFFARGKQRRARKSAPAPIQAIDLPTPGPIPGVVQAAE